MKSSTNARDYEIKESSRHPITQHSYKVGGNIGTINVVFKVKDNRDEGAKLIRIIPWEENMPKFTTNFCKRQDKSAMKVVSK